MERVNLIFLHGFLGRPQDWDQVREHLPPSDLLRVYVPDYFKEEQLGPETSLMDWGRNFNSWALDQGIRAQDKNILVGYSLGGRLSLHAFENQPLLWNQVVVISANPGFDDKFLTFEPSSDGRKARWLQDSFWAEEFLKSPWETLLKNWNEQAIFGGSAEPERSEKLFSRELLGLALTHWSVSQQKNMRPLIADYADRISWIVGELDEKFMFIARELKGRIPALKLTTVEEASHRVLFDKPQKVAEGILSCLQGARSPATRL